MMEVCQEGALVLLKIGVELKTKPTSKRETPESQEHRTRWQLSCYAKGI